MKFIHSNTKYLTPSIVEGCFEYDRHLKVDKVVTGNGFSTAFLQIRPPVGKINIMIVPNKAVIIDKQKQYITGGLDTPNKIGFFYKEGASLISDSFNLMLFVADSFFLYGGNLWKLRHKINFILVDEAHSIEIQSIYRFTLRDFDHKISRFLNKDTAIISVTASPNYFTPIDLKIINPYIPATVINVTRDRQASIDRVLNLIKNNEPVVVASNSMYIFSCLKDYKNRLKASYHVGTSLMRNLVAGAIVLPDADSNLFLLSSRGFEGMDILNENANVFFFEDRAHDYESFFIANLYQAINRTRKGAKYIEYSVRYKKEAAIFDFNEAAIDAFILDTSISCETKQRAKYKDYHDFVIFTQDKDGVFSVKKNIVSVNLHKEALMYDNGFEGFSDFIEARNIQINYLDEVQKAMKQQRRSLDVKRDFLAANIDLINKLDLFSDFNIKLTFFEKFAKYKPYLENYFIKKIYDNITTLGGVRDLNDIEKKGLHLLSSEKDFEALTNKVTRAFNKRSIEKYGKEVSKKYREAFKETSVHIVAQIILAFINSKVSVPPMWVANRNYNLLTKVGVGEIRLVGDALGITVTEVDIKSAFPRILYALNSKPLPPDFYGEGKKNKIAINKLINNLFYNESNLNTCHAHQLRNKRAAMEMLSFDSSVIDFLLSRFFDAKDRGVIMHFLSFHEKKIISEVKKNLEEFDNLGVVRRHDSVLIFGLNHYIGFLNEFTYLEQGGWFKVEADTLSELDLFELYSHDS